MRLDLEVTSHDGLQVEFKGKIWALMVSGFVMIWNEGHVWMPQSWKQGQVRLILKKGKPQTIGDAQLITLLNAHHNMHTHMLAWWLRDSMTTMCLASHCVFIPSTDITLSLSTVFVNFSHIFIFTEIVLTTPSQFRKFSNCKLQKNFKIFCHERKVDCFPNKPQWMLGLQIRSIMT